MENHGEIYIVEGPDGGGKSTQLKRLKGYFESIENREVVVIANPGCTAYGEEMRKLLLNRELRMASRAQMLGFCSTLADIVLSVVIPAMAEKKVVLFDRYIQSTIAYQSFGGGLPLHDVEIACDIASCGILPHGTFYFLIPPEEAAKRAGFSAMDRYESKDVEFKRRVLEGYMYCMREDRDFGYEIDWRLDPDHAFREVKKALNVFRRISR